MTAFGICINQKWFYFVIESITKICVYLRFAHNFLIKHFILFTSLSYIRISLPVLLHGAILISVIFHPYSIYKTVPFALFLTVLATLTLLTSSIVITS